MPIKTDQTNSQAVSKTLYPIGIDKALALLSDIRTGLDADGRGEDAQSVLDRKLEPSGVIATGTSAPVFANETALFYIDSTTKKFYVRSTSSYDEINVGSEESDIIGHNTSDPGTATETSPWIYIRTDQNKVWIKERTGSVGSYSYAWTGPIFEGAQKILVVYNPQDTPGPLNITWDWRTNTLSPSGGGWTENLANAKWQKIITGPRNSNNAIQSPATRVTDPDASDIALDTTNFNGQLSNADDNVQRAFDTLDNLQRGGGGTGTDDQTASEVNTDTSNFNQNLSSANTNVQSALDTLDNLSTPLNQSQNFGRISGTDLAATNAVADQTFTVIPSLLNARTNFDEDLFLEATVHVRMQPSTQLTGDHASVIFEVVTSSDASTGIQSESVQLDEAAGAVNRQIRISGILPPTFTAGKLRTKNNGRTGTPPAIGVEGIKLEIRPDVKADEVIVDQDDLGNNFTGDSDNLEEIVSEIDEFPIQPADFEDVDWPGGSDGVDADGDGSPVSQTITIHRNIQNFNNRPGHHFIAHISYRSNYVTGSRTDSGNSVNFTHSIYTNLSGTAISTQSITGQTVTPTDREVIVDIPNNATELRAEFTIPVQSDARLNVNDYRVDISEGIDASGFTADNRIVSNDTRTVQLLAQAVYEATGADIPVDSSGFGTNLQVADNNIQLIANRINSLTLGTNQNAAQVPITVNPAAFADPNNFIGGVRGYSEAGYESNPNDVRAALRVVDRRLEEAYNPFQSTQLLDHFTGGSFTTNFVVNSATEILSSDIDIPQAVRELGTSAAVRLRINIQALGTGWVGDVRLVHSDYGTGSPRITTTYGDPAAINNTAYSTGDTISFQRVLTAPLPDTFKIRFRRTGGTTSSTFNEGFADVIDSTNGGSGGAGGQTGYSTTIIWLAGASIYDRLITASETTNHDLMSGHSFSSYNQLAFVFDGGAGSTQPLMEIWSDVNLYQSFGAAGLLDIKGNWWLMTSRQSDRTFRFRWRGANNGLRRIVGIRF